MKQIFLPRSRIATLLLCCSLALCCGCTLESEPPEALLEQSLVRVACDENDLASCVSEFAAACAEVGIEEVPESDPPSLPDESSIADGTSLCICSADEVTIARFATFDANMEEAGEVMPVPDPDPLDCNDANAQLKQDLNDLRFEGASSETRTTGIKATSERNKIAMEKLGTAIEKGKAAVDTFERQGRITKAKADELRGHLKTADDKQKAAKAKIEASIKAADESIALAKDGQKLAKEGLDALKSCPPNAALAKQKAVDSAKTLIAGLRKEKAADADGSAGAKAGKEGLDALKPVEAALSAALPPP
jgi:hypothetical protein